MVVNAAAPSRSRTRTAACTIVSTRRADRACFGVFLGAVTLVRRLGMSSPGMRIENANIPSYSWRRPPHPHPEDPMPNTLTTPTIATLLERLYADASQSGQILGRMFGHLTREERLTRMSDPDADYRAFYGRAREVHMPVSPETGALLYMLARGNGARAIVEFGTSFGISAIHLGAALRDNGGGLLIGTELEPSKLARARANLEAAGLADLVDIREGDALETLARDLPETIDLVLLDGHK